MNYTFARRLAARGKHLLNLKYLSRCVSAAIIITALGYTFYDAGGDLLLFPGTSVGLAFTLIILLLVPTGDDYYVLPFVIYSILNVLIYTVIFYILFLVIIYIKTAQEP